MIIWTIGSGESGAADTLARAAAAATEAAADWLHTTAPRLLPWDGPSGGAIGVCVDDVETALLPYYDRRARYDPIATTRAARQLRDHILDEPSSTAPCRPQVPRRGT